MANRYYTLMIVPEKTSQVRKIVIPAWVAKSAAVGLALFTLVGVVMVLDYWYVMSQIGENKQLKMENKVTTIESTMERIKTFATRLKVITNIEDRSNLLQSLNNGKLPDAATNIGVASNASTQGGPATETAESAPQAANATPAPAARLTGLNAALGSALGGALNGMEDPEDALLRREYEQLDERFTDLNRDTLYVEQMLQDQYELLADQKSFLAALPTVKPVVGYFTNGFGVRRSPFGGRVKMYEGLDIANRPGTIIKAPADGLVTFSATKPGYGQTVIIDHGYGIETWYGHTRKFLVSKGQKVRRGEPVAQVGNSGRSTGPHLHYEVRVHGTPVDPLSYILEN